MTLEARSRWSMASRCARQGAYALLGEEPAEPDEQTRRYFLRGKQIGRYVVEQLEAKFGATDVVAEKAVEWPAGIGHADAFVQSEALTVEVKSRTSLEVTDDDLAQIAGYMHFDPDSERGGLILVHPSSLDERVLPVLLTDELRGQVEEAVERVVRAGKTGELPERCCERPSDARSKMCPFAEVCFSDWTAPPVIQVNGQVAELAPELYRAELDTKQARRLTAEAEARRDELRAQLRDVLEPGMVYEAGGYRLRRTVVKPRVTYDVASALKAGQLAEANVAAFRRVGQGHDRWSVDALDDGQPAIPSDDFGEEAPF